MLVHRLYTAAGNLLDSTKQLGILVMTIHIAEVAGRNARYLLSTSEIEEWRAFIRDLNVTKLFINIFKTM